ncbi:hypothetical protein ACB092_02G101200 [Castanea dentata]
MGSFSFKKFSLSLSLSLSLKSLTLTLASLLSLPPSWELFDPSLDLDYLGQNQLLVKHMMQIRELPKQAQ